MEGGFNKMADTINHYKLRGCCCFAIKLKAVITNVIVSDYDNKKVNCKK
jgi:hypothetical protein